MSDRDELRACYDTLCSASFWLEPTTDEGRVVMGGIYARIRALEALLQVTDPLHLPPIGAAVDSAANSLGRGRTETILRREPVEPVE